MTLTEEQTVVNVTPVATTPATPAIANAPNIKRNLPLYQYSLTATTKIPPLRRLLGKKCWREVKAIIYDDSTLKIFENPKLRDPVFEIKLENVALYLAFGKAANKYGPPPITDEEVNYIAPNNFFAVPESKDRDKIHWFAAKDEQNLKELIQIIAETVEGKVNPPQLGKGPKYRYTADEENKWKTYWIAQLTNAQLAEPVDENGGETKFVATPLVAVLEQEQQKEKVPPPPVPAKNGTAKSKSKPTPQPRQNYYNIECQMPEKVEVLTPESEGLNDSNEDEEKKYSVRLVNGKRVKEAIVVPKKSEPESAPVPPDYPPPPIPTLVVDEEHKEHIQEQKSQVSTIEVTTLTKEEPLIISTKCITIEAPPSPTDPATPEQVVEVVTTQHNAIISVASVEHTVSTSEYAVNGVSTSTSTTKETTSYQSGGTTSVH